jgi:hypothetical protein
MAFPNKELLLDSWFTPIKENDAVKNVLVISRDITARNVKEIIF